MMLDARRLTLPPPIRTHTLERPKDSLLCSLPTQGTSELALCVLTLNRLLLGLWDNAVKQLLSRWDIVCSFKLSRCASL